MMTREELMKRRAIVVADYPDSGFYVGEILYADKNGKFMIAEDWGMWQLNPSDYPHLFKELAWYEERDEKDMPEYLKLINDYSGKYGEGKVFKYSDWYKSDDFPEDMIGFVFDENDEYGKAAMYASSFLPATEQDFLNQ